MDFLELAKRRYSCRTYKDQPVEREKLTALVEAGRLSPSACNQQRWLFIVVDDPAKKELLAKSLYDPELKINGHVSKTPAYIVLVKKPSPELTCRQEIIIGQGQYWDIDMGIAAENICLCATDLGLGAVMMGRMDCDLVRSTLDIPSTLAIAMIIGVGYPLNDKGRNVGRRDLDDVLRWNSFARQE